MGSDTATSCLEDDIFLLGTVFVVVMPDILEIDCKLECLRSTRTLFLLVNIGKEQRSADSLLDLTQVGSRGRRKGDIKKNSNGPSCHASSTEASFLKMGSDKTNASDQLRTGKLKKWPRTLCSKSTSKTSYDGLRTRSTVLLNTKAAWYNDGFRHLKNTREAH